MQWYSGLELDQERLHTLNLEKQSSSVNVSKSVESATSHRSIVGTTVSVVASYRQQGGHALPHFAHSIYYNEGH